MMIDNIIDNKNININSFNRHKYLETFNLIKDNNLNTVCVEANCPNRYECFSNKTATFMILGNKCTRNCLYCNVNNSNPDYVDSDEPKRISDMIKKLGLNYCVITSVTRDDLKDFGAEYFYNTCIEIKKNNPLCSVELLIPDFKGNLESLKKVISSKPFVINHNIEVVKNLYSILRPEGSYDLSLKILKNIKEIDKNIIIKSGLMVGFGESKEDIINTLNDLKNNFCDVITIGQYLSPSNNHYPVKKYYTDIEFKEIEDIAKEIGFKKVICGKLVRSSYKASEV
jgi:lipoyl synthase